ncbi:diguanylate cyclase [Streptomyces sp. NP160]|uniref:diguanylate cyclase n=1 Tax=Streptomyces sp. NP160 TaxID=2586637 RepID=UPI0015D5F025|nr:diguanylate cyclase [Streptomyces sp. NP160]
MLDSPPAAASPTSSDAALIGCLLRSTAALAVLVLDADLRITATGPGVAALLGWPEGSLAGRWAADLLVPLTVVPGPRAGDDDDDEAEPLAEVVGRALHDDAVRGRWQLRTADGGLRTAVVTTSLDRDDDGRVRGGALVAAEVQSGDQAKEQLADSEEQFRLVFDKSPTAMAVVSLAAGTRGRIRRANAAMEAFTGRRRRELFSMAMVDVLHPDEHEAHRGYLRSAAEAGLTEPDGVLRRFVHRDGTVRLGRKSTALVTPRGAREPHLLVQLQDVTEQHAAQEALAHAALHDPLTGLANRALFSDRLEHAIAAEARARRGLTLLYADLDRFKPVNDEHGHEAGDAVLVEVAERLRRGVREEDTVARLGGDEFAVICPGLAEEHVATVVRRMTASVEGPFTLPSGAVVELGTSIGAATAVGRVPAEALVRAADAEMYRAKHGGRGGPGRPGR